MKKPGIQFVPWVASLAIVLATSSAQAQYDKVRQGEGSASGKIVSVTSTTVKLEQSAGLDKEFDVNKIDSLQYGGEPKDLTAARNQISAGQFAEAKDSLAELKIEDASRPEIAHDIAFYNAYCDAMLAMGGAGGADGLAKAGKALFTFAQQNPNSYHYFRTCELLGDIFVTLGKYPEATTYYGKLEEAPWEDYKMRSGVLVGRLLTSQGKSKEAIAKFDAVLGMKDDSPAGANEKLKANLGKAVANSSTDADGSIALVQKVIASAAPDQAELHARAYNALGSCYMQKQKAEKDALLAFLHVDVLYNNLPEAHAEALYNLGTLWEKVGNVEEARRAKGTLTGQYPSSPWAARAARGG